MVMIFSATTKPKTTKNNNSAENGEGISPLERHKSPLSFPNSLAQLLSDRRPSYPVGPVIESRKENRCYRRGVESIGEAERSEDDDEEEEKILIRLPLLKEINENTELHKQILQQKIHQCRQKVDWFAEEEEIQARRAVKADALREVMKWLCSVESVKRLEENGRLLMRELVQIVHANLFRTLPPSEQQEPEREGDFAEVVGLDPRLAAGVRLEPGWPHLQLVYRLLLQLIEKRFNNNNSNTNLTAEQQIGGGELDEEFGASFVSELLELFHSEDPREREQVKAAVHALYSSALPLRPELRKRMGWLLLEHVYEQRPCRGVPEVLEILGDIINGFNVPLKPEHRQFFLRVLLPLHKPHTYLTYFAQLSHCVVLFLEKDPTLAKPAFNWLLKSWPKDCSTKEVLMMTEMEELLTHFGPSEFASICSPLFLQLAKCAKSQHFRVAERALQLWSSENILALVVLPNCAESLLPIMLPAMYSAGESHWNDAIAALVLKLLKRLMKINSALFNNKVCGNTSNVFFESEKFTRRKQQEQYDRSEQEEEKEFEASAAAQNSKRREEYGLEVEQGTKAREKWKKNGKRRKNLLRRRTFPAKRSPVPGTDRVGATATAAGRGIFVEQRAKKE